MTVMYHMVNELLAKDLQRRTKVSQSEYEQWAREFVFEGLKNQRYGQSFCNRFNIQDNILFYSTTVDQADSYIQKQYIR